MIKIRVKWLMNDGWIWKLFWLVFSSSHLQDAVIILNHTNGFSSRARPRSRSPRRRSRIPSLTLSLGASYPSWHLGFFHGDRIVLVVDPLLGFGAVLPRSGLRRRWLASTPLICWRATITMILLILSLFSHKKSSPRSHPFLLRRRRPSFRPSPSLLPKQASRGGAGQGGTGRGGDADKPSERGRGGYGSQRQLFRGGYGSVNGEGGTESERSPRRIYERHSGTGRGYEMKRQGAGRGNWVSS
ncbi:hypothetical protein OPV22_027322 [Ensete ventricosum]|uniref:Hyaluronan/mRNA-binding protein domain-containing protein n=1 Tax=Ensete ventricosum TaxID=4639 RepID=A0AAV8PZJ3_ENSVE|nr:hypothetical protein OPV22_027322 [Ensete ventricosum]